MGRQKRGSRKTQKNDRGRQKKVQTKRGEVLMYCLDTNIIIDIFQGDKGLKTKFENLNPFIKLFITPITLCELYKGPRPLTLVDNFIESSDIKLLNFNVVACKTFGEDYIRLKKKGKLTREADLMIASIAKVNNLILITRDKKHFENTGVKIEVW